eukprot:TRINITY_DN15971_c0_g1_i1.p1 TRINITY_DN15971_c0_g1~~TRINITY_DN15971_c0_g1_i1.p1  ORF type:complete len:143 (-),score=34.05 TRINITY_DN15971_c0_g1_i1:172-600(-)
MGSEKSNSSPEAKTKQSILCGLIMKLLLILTVLHLQSSMAFNTHPARNQSVEVAINGLADEVMRLLPAGNRAFDLQGCLIDCVVKDVLPQVFACFSNPLGIFKCILEELDASCLIPDCLCSVLSILPAIVLQIFQILGICPR